LVKEFEPYKELWLGAVEFLKLQSAWMQNPFTTIDRSSLDPHIDEILNTMIKCAEQFAEVPGN